MARSPYSTSRVAKEAFRGKAKQQGRRNPGRTDGVTWQGSSFICPRKIDGPTTANLFDDTANDVKLEWFLAAERDWLDSLETSEVGLSSGRRDAPVIHSLLDIAQPAKQRGVAKDFEMIHGVRGVITLEDDYQYDADYEVWSEVGDLEYHQEESDDDWEELYEEERDKRMSYAAVLQKEK